MASKRKAAAMATSSDEPVDPADQLTFLCLGGGNEVGRSCHIVQYKGKTVMLDAGQHPAYSGFASLPFFDDFDLSTVDVLLISHFHVDHAASLPYVLAKTNFRGRVFMTHPTKAIYKWLIQDSVRVGNTSSNPSALPVYTEQDHLNTFPMIEPIDYYTTHTVSSIRITPYPAGHVLGAAMFLIEIAGLRILFTGDYSREQDRHLVSAEVPAGVRIDVLIAESTYGIASHVPRVEREQALLGSITSILNRGGRCLMPVFALGRAQELLLILDEYWARHPEYHKFPIYYASNLARKCMIVYQTYISAMNDNIKRLFRERLAEAEAAGDPSRAAGPWDFRHIRSLKSLDRFDDLDGCVILAAPGMLQNGISRELLERWAPSDKNGVIITGYSVEGTMARQIMTEPDQIHAIMTRGRGGHGLGHGARRNPAGGDSDKIMIPRRCSVQEYSFAAHVDGTENRDFIEEVNAPVVILVHGEQHAMMRLKSKLLSLNATKQVKTKVYSPRNCEELKIPFKADKLVKVVGRLAEQVDPARLGAMAESPILSGVLVQNDFKLTLMAPEDLREYAGLNTTVVVCRQHLPFPFRHPGPDLVRFALEGAFGDVEDLDDIRLRPGEGGEGGEGSQNGGAERRAERAAAFLVMGCVKVWCYSDGQATLEWEGHQMNDTIADSVVSVLNGAASSPAAVKRTGSASPAHIHSHDGCESDGFPTTAAAAARMQYLLVLLESQFGPDNISLVQTARPGSDPDPANQPIGDGDGPAGNGETAGAGALIIRMDKVEAKLFLDSFEVESSNRAMTDRIKAVIERASREFDEGEALAV